MSLPDKTLGVDCRLSHVLYCLVLYAAFVVGFSYLEAMAFGPEVLDNGAASAGLVLFEDFVEDLILVIMPIWILTRLCRASVATIGVTAREWPRNLLLGVSIGMGVWLAASLLDPVLTHLLGPTPVHPSLEAWNKSSSLWMRIASFASIAAMTPLSEELYFRGFLFMALRQLYGMWPAVVVTSALFAAVHLHVSTMVPVFGMGVVFALLFDRTRSLISVGLAHAVVNAMSLLT